MNFSGLGKAVQMMIDKGANVDAVDDLNVSALQYGIARLAFTIYFRHPENP